MADRDTAALVLAAGASRRFGGPKLLAEYRGRSLLSHSLATAEAVLPGQVHLVLGAHGDTLIDHAGNTPVIDNPDWQAGLATSIAAGVAALEDRFDHILLLLADQVALSPDHLDQLLSYHRLQNTDTITCARYRGLAGIPAVFPRPWFPSLRTLRGDKGARELLRGGKAPVAMLDIPAAAIDIDRVEDLRHLENSEHYKAP